MIWISNMANTSSTKNEEQLQQSQNYLPTYLKKVEEETDEPTTTIEKLVEVVLEEGEPKKTMWVVALLSEAKRAELVTFIRGNIDVFALSHKDMLGIVPEHAVHCLKIDPAFPPVHQQQRRFAPE